MWENVQYIKKQKLQTTELSNWQQHHMETCKRWREAGKADGDKAAKRWEEKQRVASRRKGCLF